MTTMTTSEIYCRLRKKNKDLDPTDLADIQSLILDVGYSQDPSINYRSVLALATDHDLIIHEKGTEAYYKLCRISYIIMQYIAYLDRGWPDNREVVSISDMMEFIQQSPQVKEVFNRIFPDFVY